MRKMPFILTSVFADERYMFSGNQLATLWDHTANSLNKDEMQGIAREINFSETTFIFQSETKNYVAKVRIFTPGSELPFAGHPTLGTAFVLKHKEIIPANENKATLELGIGPIDVQFFSESHVGMFQPKPELLEKFDEKAALAKALGITEDEISDDYPMQFVSTGNPFLIVPLKSLAVVQKITVNPPVLLQTLETYPSQEVLVFSRETIHNDSHAHVRMFAPRLGVLEDPATGSAAGPLAIYLETWDVIPNHIRGTDIFSEQGHEMKRPSKLHAKVLYEDNEVTKILVSGSVKLTAEGQFFL